MRLIWGIFAATILLAQDKPNTVTIAENTPLHIRTSERLSSSKNKQGDRFFATLDEPLVVNGFIIAEKGSRIEGVVTEANKGGRAKNLASLTLTLVLLSTSDGQKVSIQTDKFTKKSAAVTKDDAADVAFGAVLGTVIGAAAGGGKGAAIGAGAGAAAGAAGAMMTKSPSVDLRSETKIDFKLAEAVTLTEKLADPRP